MLNTLPDLGLVAVHTLALYIFLIMGFSLLGRRQSSELTATELVVIILIGSAVETGLVAGNKTLPAGLVSAGILLLFNHFFTLLQRHHPRLRHLLLGRPIPLVYKGHFLPVRMRQAGLTEDEVLEGMRLKGYDRVEDVRLAMLEIDGTVSVVPLEKEAKRSRAS